MMKKITIDDNTELFLSSREFVDIHYDRVGVMETFRFHQKFQLQDWIIFLDKTGTARWSKNFISRM